MSTQAQSSAQATVEVIEQPKLASRAELANEAASMGFESGRSFLHLQRVAAMFAASDLVPDAFRGNVANCSIAVNLARRLGADELMVMQNLYVVYGRPGWSSKFKIAMFNQTGKFTPVKYRFTGQKGHDSFGCVAHCTEKDTGELIEGPEITIALAKAEGWYDRKSKSGGPASKWPTMTELMLRYRSASWMIDTTAPELTMGLKTVEELLDTEELMEQVIKTTEQRAAEKRQAEQAAKTAIEGAPSKLDALMEAGKAKGNGKDAQAQPPAPPVDQKAADAAMAHAKETMRRKAEARDRTNKPELAGNPNYAESEPNPFAPGGDLFTGRDPGQEG